MHQFSISTSLLHSDPSFFLSLVFVNILFSSLQYAQTDIGRCRAWIRLAANECSLESYITVLCQDTQLLKYAFNGTPNYL